MSLCPLYVANSLFVYGYVVIVQWRWFIYVVSDVEVVCHLVGGCQRPSLPLANFNIGICDGKHDKQVKIK